MNAASIALMQMHHDSAVARSRAAGIEPSNAEDKVNAIEFLGAEAMAFIRSKMMKLRGMDFAAEFAGGLRMDENKNRADVLAKIAKAPSEELERVYRIGDERAARSENHMFFSRVDNLKAHAARQNMEINGDQVEQGLATVMSASRESAFDHRRPGGFAREMNDGLGLIAAELDRRGTPIVGTAQGRVLPGEERPTVRKRMFALPEALAALDHESRGEFLLAQGVTGLRLPSEATNPQLHLDNKVRIAAAEDHEIVEVLMRTDFRAHQLESKLNSDQLVSWMAKAEKDAGGILGNEEGARAFLAFVDADSKTRREQTGVSLPTEELADVVMFRAARIELVAEAEARGLKVELIKNKEQNMDFDSKKVDEIVKNAEAMLKIDTGSELYAALEMDAAISARAIRTDEFSNRYVVEAAESYVSDLDDRSKSGSPEWDALSKSVDEARKPVLDAEKARGHNLAAQMAAAANMAR